MIGSESSRQLATEVGQSTTASSKDRYCHLHAEHERLTTRLMSLKAKLEAIIYAAETPISLDQIVQLVKDSVLAELRTTDDAEIKSRVRAALEELIADYSGRDSRHRNPPDRRRISHVHQARAARRGARLRQEPEAADSAVASGARNAGRHRLQAAGHGARDQRNSRRRFRAESSPPCSTAS